LRPLVSLVLVGEPPFEQVQHGGRINAAGVCLDERVRIAPRRRSIFSVRFENSGWTDTITSHGSAATSAMLVREGPDTVAVMAAMFG
jgi:hypothetical protein